MIKPTKKWRLEKAREIIDRNKMNIPFSDQDTKEFAEACEQPITGAVRKINPQYPSDPRHLHTEIDGIWAARSWRKFIHPVPPIQQAKRIMRHVVGDDMRDFSGCVDPRECAWCGSTDDLTVDHVAPPFDDIASEYIEMFGLPEFQEPATLMDVVNCFADIDVEAQWVAFHASRACYQMLCRSCNSKKGKR